MVKFWQIIFDIIYIGAMIKLGPKTNHKNISSKLFLEIHFSIYRCTISALKWYILMSTTSMVSSFLMYLPSTGLSTSNSHHLNVVTNVENIKENFDVNHHHQSISHPSLNKFQLKWYMWSDYVRNLPGILLLGILAVHGVVDHQLTRTQCCDICWKYKNFHVNHHHHCISHPSWRNFQLKWYIIVSATSLVFSSLLFLPSTVPSTTKPNEQKVGKWGIQEKEFHWTS